MRKPISIRDQLLLTWLEQLDKAWLLGYIAGDGNLYSNGNTHKLCLHIGTAGKDDDVAEKCKQIIESLYGTFCNWTLEIKNDGIRKPQNKLVASRKNIIADIIKLCPRWLGNKTRSWNIPDYILGNIELERKFVGGVAEAEGHVSYTKSNGVRIVCVVTSASKTAVETVSAILEKNGIENQIYPDRNCWKVCVTNERAIRLYNDLFPFISKRKKDLMQELINSYGEDRGRCNRGELKTYKEDLEKFLNEFKSYSEIVKILEKKTGLRWNPAKVGRAIVASGLKGYGKGGSPTNKKTNGL